MTCGVTKYPTIYIQTCFSPLSSDVPDVDSETIRDIEIITSFLAVEMSQSLRCSGRSELDHHLTH